MPIKAIITALSIISFTANANWAKSEESLYSILKINDAKIINTSVLNKSWLMTTIEAQSKLYRCADVLYQGKFRSDHCWILESD